jgi:hypothetical protein
MVESVSEHDLRTMMSGFSLGEESITTMIREQEKQ